MNFDERLAQTQAKMEELKAKIFDSIDSAKKESELRRDERIVKIAKMYAAIEDFNKDVEAQVICDVDAMKDEIATDVNAFNEAMDDLNEKIDNRIKERSDKYNEKADSFQAKVDDFLSTMEGNANAAQENVRIAKEQYKSKLDSTLLKIQMQIEAIKARIADKKAELEKEDQEEYILDLLDYADYCQQMALAYAMNAELAILDACDEIDNYVAKYGKSEQKSDEQ